MEVLTIDVPDVGTVSGLWQEADPARAVLVLAHGAGAGMKHPFLADIAAALADRGVSTLRFQFPYMERGRRRPDGPARAMQTVRAAVAAGAGLAGDMPLYAGGKSFGGRMTSSAAAAEPLPGVRGIVFFGFPLHRPGTPGTERANHLVDVAVPMLFLQGTRDALADLAAMRRVVADLGPQSTLHVVEGGDHSFRVPKRLGMDEVAVRQAMAGVAADWMHTL
jgi:predicted alpha/beta-hydrolase family hydrolase